jgi:hypothetical protein
LDRVQLIVFKKPTTPVRRHSDQEMAPSLRLVHDVAVRRDAKALFNSAMGFNFWHGINSTCLLAGLFAGDILKFLAVLFSARQVLII